MELELEPERRGAVVADLPILRFLPEEVKAALLEGFVEVAFPFGAEIVRQGEAAESFFLVVRGRVRVVKRADNGDEVILGTLRTGDTFGEQGLLEGGLEPNTVRASTAVELVRLDRPVFDAVVGRSPEVLRALALQARHRHLLAFLRQYTAFAALPTGDLTALLEALTPVEVRANELIFAEGDPPGPLYVIEEGRCRASIGVEGRERVVAWLRQGEYFGEQALFGDQRRPTTVRTVSACRLLVLTREEYQDLLERAPAFREAIADQQAQVDFRHTAAIPIDFYRELLPAAARASNTTGEVPSLSPGVADDTEPFAVEGRFIKQRRRIRRFPHVWQIDAMDCAAASLAMVCRHYGREVNLARIRRLLHTGFDGTSLQAICEGAEELGLASRSVKVSRERLDALPLPAIAHYEGNHWLVVYHVDRNHVWVSDPAVGRRRLSRAGFESKWTGYTALFEPTAGLGHAPEAQLGLSWLTPYVRPYASILLQATALALVVSALQLVVPVATQVIVDRVLVEHDAVLLHGLVATMAVVCLVMLVGTLLQRYLLSFAAVRIDSATLDVLTRRLLALPMEYFTTRRTGDIQRRLAGIWQVREFAVEQGVGALTAVTGLLTALTLMLVYSPLLALVFLATMPLLLGLMRVASAWLGPLYAELETAYGKYQAFQIDAIKGIETVKALAAEHTFRRLMLRQFNGVARGRFKADFTVMSYHGLIQSVTLLTVILFLLVGAHQVIAGRLSIGALVAFNALVVLANGSLTSLLTLWDRLQQVRVYLNRLDDLFQAEPEQGYDRSRLVPVPSLSGRVTLNQVGFRYGGPGAPTILENLSVEIPPDTKVAIVGRSGSGKTTLVKLLAGLIEPTAGTILYDGIDLKTLNYRELRRKIGFVLQENHLFDDSITRNIAFGEDEPDLERVTWAAEAANAREFVERLPLGYDSRIGETGLALSGGQRQRIAIARAIYHKPPILIFDEATSALDTESERAVKENLDQLLTGRTAFVIAHRLSTVRDADLILVLEKGRLVEQGTHDDLMRRQGLYFFLVSQQLEI